MTTTRRDFLRATLGTAAGSAALGVIAPLTSRAGWLAGSARAGRRCWWCCSGSNDGLNMVVPFAHNALPCAPAPPCGADQVLALNDEVGFQRELAPLKELFDRGMVAVVQGVGYPHPDRSHFRSMDIWHTAAPEVRCRAPAGLVASQTGSVKGQAALACCGSVPARRRWRWLRTATGEINPPRGLGPAPRPRSDGRSARAAS
ncbi:MAG: twin-arginine translocation signal domain-containing protein [Planctomycetota bacterium]